MLAGNPVNSWFSASSQISLTLVPDRILPLSFILLFPYREVDRGTMYFRNCLNQTDLKGLVIDKDIIDENLVRKVLFKSIVYRLINKMETFMDFKGGIPDEENFSQFLKLLKKKKDHGSVIFTAAHQNNGYHRFLITIDYVRKNISKMAAKIGKKHALKKYDQFALNTS